MKQLAVVLLLIFLLSLVACGKPEEPAQSKDVVVDYQQSLVAHRNLLKQHEQLKVFSESLQAREAEHINTINALNSENFGLKAEAVIQRAQVEQLAGNLNKAQNELLQVDFEGETQLERLQEEYEKVAIRLRQLDLVYPAREFPSVATLKEWLADDDTDSRVRLKAGADGVVSFKGVCDKYAMQLMDRALLDGFKMSFYIMDGDEYFERYEEEAPVGKLHAVNLVIIGNNVYLVDPQNDGVWLKCYLD